MAAAVHGVVRAGLDAEAVVALHAREQRVCGRRSEAGYDAELRVGDADDSIPALLEVSVRHQNRVDLLVGLMGVVLEAMNRMRQVALAGATLEVVGRHQFCGAQDRWQRHW